MEKAEQALDLAARGFKVFPVKAGAKTPPLLSGWPTRATSDPDTVRSFWSAVPEANIAISCEGLLVLDIDSRKGGTDSFELLADIHAFPATLTSLTPNGRHLFYALPEGHPGVPNSVEALGPGLDTRSTGGYVVAPGSVVEAGEYRFEHPGAAIAPAPAWLVEKLGTVLKRPPSTAPAVPPAPESALDAAKAWLEAQGGAVEGQGGDAHTFAVACGLRDRGVSIEQATELMSAWNDKCTPPWTPREIVAKVRNAYRYAQNEPGARVALPQDFDTVETSTPTTAKVRNRAMRLVEFAGSEKKGPGYLVKGFLQRASHAVMYGSPGAGKTFVALDVAYHVAAGKPWMDRKVRQGPVVYLAFEGIGGLRKRAQALMQHYGKEDVPLYIVDAPYNLREQAGRKELAVMLGELGVRPALIVIDTLARALNRSGGDENSAQDMGAMNDAVSELVKASGACVMLVHHSGKNKSAGARGSSALQGAIDTELEVENYQILPRKQRDMELCEPINFALRSMVVGLDEDGDEETSCVVVPSSAPVETGLPRISGNARHGFDVLCDMAPDNAPVSMVDWREACQSAFLGGKSVPQRFYELVKTLRSKGYVVVQHDMVTRRLE